MPIWMNIMSVFSNASNKLYKALYRWTHLQIQVWKMVELTSFLLLAGVSFSRTCGPERSLCSMISWPARFNMMLSAMQAWVKHMYSMNTHAPTQTVELRVCALNWSVLPAAVLSVRCQFLCALMWALQTPRGPGEGCSETSTPPATVPRGLTGSDWKVTCKYTSNGL